MGLIKTLIISGAAVAIVKDFNKEKRRKREAEELSGRQQYEYNNDIPPPPQHGQPSRSIQSPPPPAQVDQHQQYDPSGGNHGPAPAQYSDESKRYTQSSRALYQVDAGQQQGIIQAGNAPFQYYGHTNGKATTDDDQFPPDPK